MRLPVAYSTDAERTVDVEEAYELFWEGQILGKQNFECADENCDIQITAANLSKLRENMKRDPFYTTKNLHSPSCGFNPQNIEASGNGKPRKKRTVTKSSAVHFCTTRPKSHYQIKKEGDHQDSGEYDRPVTQDRSRRKRQDRETRQETPRRYSITPLVSHYSKLKHNGQKGSEIIETDNFKISYDEMFVKIDNQSLADLSTFWRIYYGEADIIKLKDGKFLVKFHEAFDFEGQVIQPSLFISKELLDKAFNKKLKENKLMHYSSKREPAWVFVYSQPTPHTSKDEKQYLNLNIKTMDFFDLRNRF